MVARNGGLRFHVDPGPTTGAATNSSNLGGNKLLSLSFLTTTLGLEKAFISQGY